MGVIKVTTTTVRNIPEDIFDAFLIIKSERAKAEGKEISKNELYVEALTEYVEKHRGC